VQQAIPLDELTVGVRHGRFRIRWSRHNADVLVCTGHMLNSSRAPTVCRFLSDVRHDGVPQLGPFSWGGTSDFPYLPRVERGRIVLSLARWRLDPRLGSTPGRFQRALNDWRFDWQVPRYVYLAAGDNRLLLDLDDSAHVAQLRDEARRAPQNSFLLLEEALPGPHDAWLEGPGGRYITELVVSLALSHAPDRKPVRQQQESSAPWRLRPVVSRRDQVRPAGSDWLFLKLYGPSAGQDEFLTGPMAAFCAAMQSSGLVRDWFFVRYNDPAAHIRLRFRGEPADLTSSVLPQFCSWSARLIDDGVISRVCVDTYEREVTRYGGPAAIEAAEALFAADSRAAIDLLELCRRPDSLIDRTGLSILNIDSLLAAFGLDARRRMAWCQAHVVSKMESGAEYRERNRALRVYLSDPPAGLVAVFTARASSLERVRARLDVLAATGLPLDDLLSSFVHMSCNRLSGPQWPSEQRTIGLLLRIRAALLHMPAGSS
jgi:thiopeptide-type bacteriocin biosynthesis protein